MFRYSAYVLEDRWGTNGATIDRDPSGVPGEDDLSGDAALRQRTESLLGPFQREFHRDFGSHSAAVEKREQASQVAARAHGRADQPELGEDQPVQGGQRVPRLGLARAVSRADDDPAGTQPPQRVRPGCLVDARVEDRVS